MLSRKKATFLNIFYTSVYQFLTVLFGFVIPNLLLNQYGVELHGYTSTVSNIMGYIAIINAGLAPAAVEAMYKPLAEKEPGRINEVLNAIDRFYVRAGILYTIAVIIAAGILPIIVVGQIPTVYAVSLMIVIGATNTLDCFIYSKYRILFQADQKLFAVYIIDSIAYLLRILLQVFLILKKADIVLVMGVPALMVVARTMLLERYSKKSYPYLDKKVKPDYSALGKRKNAMLHQIAGLVVYNTDVTLLTLFGNLAQVSIYSVYSLVFNHLYTFLTNIFSNSTLASFGNLMYEKRREKLLSVYDLYEYGYYMVVSFIYGVTASMMLPFVSVYTRKYQAAGYVDVKLVVLFMIIGLANNMRVPSGTMINAAGHFKETQWRAVLEAAINLITSLLLIVPFGMYGILFGTVCSFAYRTTDIIYYSHKYILNTNCKKVLLRICRTIFCVLFSAGLYQLIWGISSMDSWGQWILHAIYTSILTGVVVLMIHFATEPKIFLKFCETVFRKTGKK